MTVAGISRQAGHTTASRGSGHIVGRVGRLNEYCFGLSFLLSTLPFRDSFYSSPPPKTTSRKHVGVFLFSADFSTFARGGLRGTWLCT